jgi:hypothetical protein
MAPHDLKEEAHFITPSLRSGQVQFFTPAAYGQLFNPIRRTTTPLLFVLPLFSTQGR